MPSRSAAPYSRYRTGALIELEMVSKALLLLSDDCRYSHGTDHFVISKGRLSAQQVGAWGVSFFLLYKQDVAPVAPFQFKASHVRATLACE